MTKTATLTPSQEAALFCYRWYTSTHPEPEIPAEGIAALQSIFGSQISATEMLQFGRKMRQADNFDRVQQQLIKRWSGRLGPDQSLNEEDAQAFILELFSEVNHSVIYDHGITANSSMYERGFISDSEMLFTGDMPCWTLHLTVRGSALFLNDHMEVTVEPGDMMLFHPDACYHYGLHPAADDWEHLWVLFQPRPQWSEWLEWEELDRGIWHISLGDADTIALMEGLFRQLIALGLDTTSYQSDLQYNRLEEIIIRAKEHSLRPERVSIDARIQNACDYIQAHLANRFSVDDVAAACNLSPSRMAHLFKEHMGVSLKSWSGDLRLQQARKKLINGNDSIAVVASEVGYDDPTQFTKYFKKNLGCSPREFRQSFKGR
jgi:AraC family transcriptional regulator of arabinose operon